MTNEEEVRRLAALLNNATAKCIRGGYTILVETDENGEQIYVHVGQPEVEERDALSK